jgi:hypothetical protein
MGAWWLEAKEKKELTQSTQRERDTESTEKSSNDSADWKAEVGPPRRAGGWKEKKRKS